MKYSLTKRENDEIDCILNSGINQMRNSNLIKKSYNEDIKPFLTNNSLNFSGSSFNNSNQIYNCFAEGNLNNNNFQKTNSFEIKKSYDDINDVLKNLSFNYSKPKCEIYNNNEYIQNNYNYDYGNLSPEDYKISKKYVIDDNVSNNIIIDKITEKEIEIMKIRNELENDEKIKINLKEEINKLEEELSKERKENNKKKEELEIIRKYRNECEQMQFQFETLMRQFHNSEEIRQNQKNLLQKIQNDIDCVRQQSLNKINQIEMMKQINFENEIKYNEDDECCNKQNKKKKKGKSKSKEKNKK
jgi:hypothetical protein